MAKKSAPKTNQNLITLLTLLAASLVLLVLALTASIVENKRVSDMSASAAQIKAK